MCTQVLLFKHFCLLHNETDQKGTCYIFVVIVAFLLCKCKPLVTINKRITIMTSVSKRRIDICQYVGNVTVSTKSWDSVALRVIAFVTPIVKKINVLDKFTKQNLHFFAIYSPIRSLRSSDNFTQTFFMQ